MKKVALVTCYFQPNYGSMLQAYATQQILDNWNIPNETICIDGFAGEIKKAKLEYFKSRMFSPDVIKDKWGFVKLAIAKKIYKNTLGKNISIRKKQFDKFAREQFRLSKVYSSKSELGSLADNYSAFLVGSDQLWLPSNIAADYYTLNFVPKDIRKIAYATSFGVSSLPKNTEKSAKMFLPRIDYLSVREKSGQKLIKDLTGMDVPVVCDPTLLLTADEWKTIQVEEPFIKDKYIFCYFLGNNPYPRQFAKELKNKTGYKIVALQQLDAYIRSDIRFADEAPYNVGPSDFINLIRNAEFVCTDSFHGTVFSILNRKTFFSFRRFKTKSTMSTNSRIDSLLEVLNIRSRILEGHESVEKEMNKSIDYSLVESKLETFIEDSKKFLYKALKDLE
ncbi:polysaccharide pyruvyl transferase [Clostridium sp. Bc-iso-3]|nr:polysaccharide pyruvyl transferase [Clostridium sp. Bc-iso-3]